MALVVDASIALKWFLRDERSPLANTVLEQIRTDGAYVPALFRWEIQSVLLVAERAYRLTRDDVDEALDFLRDLPVIMDPAGERAFSGTEVELARQYDLTPYDAAYLSIAAGRGLPLATADAELAHAARDLSVSVLFDERSA